MQELGSKGRGSLCVEPPRPHWDVTGVLLPSLFVSFCVLLELTCEIDGWAPFAFLLEALGHQIHFALGFCVYLVNFQY